MSHECKLSNLPLTIQKQWLDPHECYFEIRQKQDHKPQTTVSCHWKHTITSIYHDGILFIISTSYYLNFVTVTDINVSLIYEAERYYLT